MIQLWYSPQTIPEEKTKWIARLLQSVLENMPATLEQPLEHIVGTFDEMPQAGSTAEPSHSSAAALQNGDESLSPPSALTQAIVSQTWKEVGLIPSADSQKEEQESEDRSMFSNAAGAADLVNIMLLSRCYKRNGYNLSMQDLINHPTQNGQASLLE
ncbi:MAG: hypothetical protein Q9228_003944 [Teloschistes exilis]